MSEIKQNLKLTVKIKADTKEGLAAELEAMAQRVRESGPEPYNLFVGPNYSGWCDEDVEEEGGE